MITESARLWADQSFPSHKVRVTRTDIVRYARAIGETDPVHLDVEAARAAGHIDILAPPYFPYVLRNQVAHLVDRGMITPDGSAAADVPPLQITSAMAGETEITIGQPIHAGDTVTVGKRIIDLYDKVGRSGPLVFVRTEYTFHNQNGSSVFTERFTRIYK